MTPPKSVRGSNYAVDFLRILGTIKLREHTPHACSLRFRWLVRSLSGESAISNSRDRTERVLYILYCRGVAALHTPPGKLWGNTSGGEHKNMVTSPAPCPLKAFRIVAYPSRTLGGPCAPAWPLALQDCSGVRQRNEKKL
jgi:hypothetical protein